MISSQAEDEAIAKDERDCIAQAIGRVIARRTIREMVRINQVSMRRAPIAIEQMALQMVPELQEEAKAAIEAMRERHIR